MSYEMRYEESLYKGKPLIYWATRALEHIPDGAILVYRGSSGCALGSAVMVLGALRGMDIQGLYVRKDHEDSHGSSLSGALASAKRQSEVYFVDDFISEGHTLRQVLIRLRDYRLLYSCVHIVVRHCLNEGVLEDIKADFNIQVVLHEYREPLTDEEVLSD